MERVKQRRLGAEAWRGLLAKFAESGLTAEAFCTQEGISRSSLTRWRSRVRVEGRTQSARRRSSVPAAGEFVDLGTMTTPAAARGERFELRLDLGGGLILQLVRG